MNEIAEYIKKTRILRGLSVRAVAAECNVSPSTVSRWESGEISNMGRDKIMLLAKAIWVDPDVIAGVKPIMPLSSAQEILVALEKDSYTLSYPTGELLRACIHLSDAQKEAVLQVIRAMTGGKDE